MMKIILANLPWKDAGKVGVRAGSRWPHLKGYHEWAYLPFPFFLAYAASLLKKHNFEVRLVDAIAEGLSYGQFIKQIHQAHPDLLVCETSTVTLYHDLALLERIGRDIPIALCGPDVNIRQAEFLQNRKFITYVFSGEYEFTLLDLAVSLREGGELDDILGLIYRDAASIRVNPPRPLLDLDQLPWPLREGLFMGHYNDAPGDMPLPSVQMMASRGCPYSCKFCLWPQVMYQGSNYRTRDIIDVVDEMEYLAKERNFKSIYFDDDTFNCGKERMLRLCAEIKRRDLRVPWAIMARPDLMDEEILKSMKEAGLYAVKYGVESAHQDLLDNINKKMDIGKAQEVIRITKALDIKTHLTFTFGLPGETRESIRKTIDFALKLDPASIQFSIATPFPGTAFYAEMERKGLILSRNWSEYDGNFKSVIGYEHLTRKDLERALRSAYKQWAYHCTRERYLDGLSLEAYYSRLLVTYLKKYGLLKTVIKAVRFLMRFSVMLCREGLGYPEGGVKGDEKAEELRLGRLTLTFSAGRFGLYWEGRKLTAGRGLTSCISVNSTDRSQCYCAPVFGEPEKIGEAGLRIKIRHALLPADETWLIEVIDEKQIDWKVDIQPRDGAEILETAVAVILSGQYRSWMDAWGDGRFYPAHEYREVPLRTPNTNFIGVRGRRKIRGRLPTVLLDLMGVNNGFYPAIRNSALFLGARTLEIKIKGANGGLSGPGSHLLFSGRIKIVEEGSPGHTPVA